MSDPSVPTAALLIIGNEVLGGHVVDANGPFLLSTLRARGVTVTELRVLTDSEPAIVEAINTLRRRVTRVVCTGGIGPTHDDVTVRALAHAFGKPVVIHAELAAAVTRAFGEAGAARAMRLAEVPEGAEVLLDTKTLVPIISLANVTLLPGVPAFVRASADAALGELRGTPPCAAEWRVEAHETTIAADLAAVQDAFDELAIGSYPQFSGGKASVLVRIEGAEKPRVQAALKELRRRLRGRRPR